MHPLVELARKSIETYIRERKIIEPPESVSPEMTERAGVFVCLKQGGKLRGCIGTYMPCYDSVAKEIIINAISAATKDPRFSPLMESELGELEYSVDVLSLPQKVKDVKELDPQKYGIIFVSSGYKRGILLPDLDGVDTVEEQIRIARMKAGILLEEDVEMYRFEVRRYT